MNASLQALRAAVGVRSEFLTSMRTHVRTIPRKQIEQFWADLQTKSARARQWRIDSRHQDAAESLDVLLHCHVENPEVFNVDLLDHTRCTCHAVPSTCMSDYLVRLPLRSRTLLGCIREYQKETEADEDNRHTCGGTYILLIVCWSTRGSPGHTIRAIYLW